MVSEQQVSQAQRLLVRREEAALASERLVASGSSSTDIEQKTDLRFHAELAQWHRDRAALQTRRIELWILRTAAERFERERDEACEAILRVEAFIEQLETEKFWIGLASSPVAAIATRIRAELKPRP